MGGNTRSHYVSRLKAELMLSRRLNGQTARILARRRHLTSAVRSLCWPSPNFGDTTYSMCVLINHLPHLVYVCVVSAWVCCQRSLVSLGIITEQGANCNRRSPPTCQSISLPFLHDSARLARVCVPVPQRSSDGPRYKNTH